MKNDRKICKKINMRFVFNLKSSMMDGELNGHWPRCGLNEMDFKLKFKSV